jgi:hypothetical protein
MGLSVGVNGTYHGVPSPKVGAGGSWRTLVQGWVGVGGAWKAFFAAFSPVTHTYTSGSGSETVPAGASSVTIMTAGHGADGQPYDDGNAQPGLGGGGGGTAVRTIAISASDWGQTLAWDTFSLSGQTTVTGTLTAGSVNMIGNLGGYQAGGTASGGDTNYTGESGSGPLGGSAGGPGSGFGGNGGTNPGEPGNPGGDPTVQFAWT